MICLLWLCPACSSHQCAKLRIYIWVWLFLSAKTTGKGNVKPSESLKNIGRSKKGCKNGNIEFILTFKILTFRQTAFVCVCPLFLTLVNVLSLTVFIRKIVIIYSLFWVCMTSFHGTEKQLFITEVQATWMYKLCKA